MALLSKDEQQQVADAVKRVERDTDAELVTVLAARADNYAYIPLLWAGLLALVVPGAVNYFFGGLTAYEMTLVQWASFIVLGLIFRLPVITMRLVPRSVRHWRAANLARRQFLEHNLHHTEGDTGILIFVSEAERYVEILVDRGISSRISDDSWQSVVASFTRHVKDGETLKGFLQCIDDCGKHLKEQVPATHERNELPNRLIVLD